MLLADLITEKQLNFNAATLKINSFNEATACSKTMTGTHRVHKYMHSFYYTYLNYILNICVESLRINEW